MDSIETLFKNIKIKFAIMDRINLIILCPIGAKKCAESLS